MGATVAIRNNAGDTPLDLAYKKKSKVAVIAALEAAARQRPFRFRNLSVRLVAPPDAQYPNLPRITLELEEHPVIAYP